MGPRELRDTGDPLPETVPREHQGRVRGLWSACAPRARQGGGEDSLGAWKGAHQQLEHTGQQEPGGLSYKEPRAVSAVCCARPPPGPGLTYTLVPLLHGHRPASHHVQDVQQGLRVSFLYHA